MSTLSFLSKKLIEDNMYYDSLRPFGYNGGTYSDSDVEEAKQLNIPLTFDLSIPGKCRNKCSYCGYYEVNEEGKLTFAEIKKIIEDFASLGGRSIRIVGEGEPFLRSDLMEILKCMRMNRLIPVVFSCGDVLGDSEVMTKIHGQNLDHIFNELLKLQCTIVLKYDLPDQDSIVGRSGYSRLRNHALEKLIDHGFNKYFPSHLAFGTVVLNGNIRELPKIFRFALSNNIYPLFCPLMPVGKMKDPVARAKVGPTKEEVRHLIQKLLDNREEFGIPKSILSDFPGGLPCDISRCGFYIDDAGNFMVCESDSTVGNIRKETLGVLWKRASRAKDRAYGEQRWCGFCFPKRSKGIL